MKKIRVTVPYSVLENLKNDCIEFEIEKIGTLGNKILNYYLGKELTIVNIKSEKGEILQFNLTKSNEELFFEGLRKVQRDNKLVGEDQLSDAEYVRNIIYEYLNNPRHKREKIVYNSVITKIEEAVKRGEKVKIKYGNVKEYRTISPYFIKKGDRDNRVYILCWCEKNLDYRSYRVAKILETSKSFEERETKDFEYIKKLEENFDPFRTFGAEVVVRLTKEGERLLKSAITNRPKQLNKEDTDRLEGEEVNRIYRFQCNEALGKIYFPQFFNEAEILEPQSLREWFRNRYKEGLKLYDIE